MTIVVTALTIWSFFLFKDMLVSIKEQMRQLEELGL